MTNSPGQQPRAEVAPPRESAGRLHRTGYLALAASGLALSTSFAAVAHIAGPEDTPAQHQTTAQAGRSTNTSGGGGPELVPGEAVPAEATVVIDGVAVTGTLPTSADSPTTVVSIGTDGEPTTSVYTPPKKDPKPTGGNSSPTDDSADPPDDSESPSEPSSGSSQTETSPSSNTSEPTSPPTEPEEPSGSPEPEPSESENNAPQNTTGGGMSTSGESAATSESPTGSTTSHTTPSTTSRSATTSLATPTSATTSTPATPTS